MKVFSIDSAVGEMRLTYGIEIHVNIDGSELLDSIVHAGEVSRLSVSTLLDGQVGDQVGKGVGLNDRDDTDIGILCSNISAELSGRTGCI